jgi:hypothetical protein
MSTGKISTMARLLRRLPFKPMFAITVACLVIGEQYPFSDFPMYSSFGKSTYYLYVADENDQPLGSMPTLGMSTPTLKKVFSTEMRKEREALGSRSKKLTPEQKRVVGERLLARLRASRAAQSPDSPPPSAVRLYEVNISLENGRFQKERVLIAESR